jgi:hypothetical protein
MELDSSNCGVVFEELWSLVLPFIPRINLLLLTPSEIIKLSTGAGIRLDVSESKELHTDVETWTRQLQSLLDILKCECICSVFPVDGYKSFAVTHKTAGFAWTRPEDVSGSKIFSRYIRACMMKEKVPKTPEELRSVIELIGIHSDLVTDNWEIRNTPSPKAQRN